MHTQRAQLENVENEELAFFSSTISQQESASKLVSHSLGIKFEELVSWRVTTLEDPRLLQDTVFNQPLQKTQSPDLDGASWE